MASAAQTIHRTFGRTNTAPLPVAFRPGDPRTWPAGIARPFKQCDGQWITPMFDPIAKAWIAEEVAWTDEPYTPVTRAACGDPKCVAYHISKRQAEERRGRRANQKGRK